MFGLHKYHADILTLWSHLPIAYTTLTVIETAFVADQTGLEISVTQMFSLQSGYCFTKNSSLRNSFTTVMILKVGHVNFLN